MKKLILAASACAAATALATPAMAVTVLDGQLGPNGTATFTFTTTGGPSSIAVDGLYGSSTGIQDPSIWVFANNLGGAYIAYNDDYGSLNSYLSLNLAAGTYVATIGRYYFEESEARSGVADYTAGQTDFQITFGDGLSVAGAVPEPSAWALLILGFGTVGAAMRRRKQAVRVSFA